MSLSWNLIILRHVRREHRRKLVFIRRHLRDIRNPFEVTTDEQFVDLYRFPKHLCLELIHEIDELMFVNFRSSSLPVYLRVLSALRYFATGGFQRTIGRDFLSCMSQTSMHRIIHEVSEALNNIWNRYVYFPDDNEQLQIKEEFFEKFSFPGVIGVIDGSHIKIIAPNCQTERAYVCRKGGHSINALLVCDSKYIIRYANSKFPGTSHDAYIWRRSALQQYCQRKYSEGKRNFWLLGDSGFPQQPWLMTPFCRPNNSAQENYNVAHKSARCIIERCIGILKSRFRCLARTLNYEPVKAGKIINACVVLHNILQRANVPIYDEINVENAEDEAHTSMLNNEIQMIGLREGQRIRDGIVETYFT